MIEGCSVSHQAEVVIIGGGPVGLVLGRALARAGLAVVICETRSAHAAGAALSGRPIALAHGSRRILEQLDVWSSLRTSVHPIRTVEVSARGSFGVTRLTASKLGVPALGYVVDGGELESALAAGLAMSGGELTILYDTMVESLSQAGDRVKVHGMGGGGVGEGAEVVARLAVLAHGVNDEFGAALGLTLHRVDFHQSALVAEVDAGQAHGDVAFERFTSDGPIALLPLAPGRFGLVWTGPKQQCEARAHCEPPAVLGELTRLGGGRFGNLSAVRGRQSVDLVAVRASLPSTGRVTLIGNAAQSLHPVAGQGMNLGLRDAAMLAELCVAAHRRGEDIGASELVQRFHRMRNWDRRLTTSFTDLLAVGFSQELAPLTLIRGAGLALLDIAGPLKQVFARQCMGLGRPLPRLMRGLPL